MAVGRLRIYGVGKFCLLECFVESPGCVEAIVGIQHLLIYQLGVVGVSLVFALGILDGYLHVLGCDGEMAASHLLLCLGGIAVRKLREGGDKLVDICGVEQ